MTSTAPLSAISDTELREKRSSIAAQIALATGALYLAIVIALQFFRTDISINWQTTSEYARGPSGWVMVVAFLLSGASLLSFAFASRPIVRSVAGRIGAIVLTVAAIGVVAGGIFITDPIDTPQTELSASGTAHGLAAGLALMLTPIAALVLNTGLARRAGSAKLRITLIVTGVLPLAALIMFMTVQTVLLPADGQFGPAVPIGPAERVLVVAYAAWQLATSAILARRHIWQLTRKKHGN